MLDLTLQQLFGVNASQDLATITIHKADLPGLTPTGNNHAEALLVGLILQACQQFEGNFVDEQNRVITDELGRFLTYNHHDVYEKLNVWFWKRQFINSYQLDTFVIDVFVNPPPDYGTLLDPDTLAY